MPDQTPNLALPYILPAQAQKHVTHNDALRVLDYVTQISVASASVTVPPLNATEGQRYIVPAGATGTWAGKSGKIAVYEQGNWVFLNTLTGWNAWVQDASQMRIYNGTAWVTADVTLPTQMAQLGIGTSPDSNNKFAVSSPATLLTHAGAGHQIKVNKAGISDTASLLFQTNWSGRAEMGLTGSDAFAIKVSANGSTFNTALTTDPASGIVTLPQPVSVPLRSTPPPLPATDTISVYGAKRGGAGWLEVARPSGRTFALQPSFAMNRVASWAPSTATTVNTQGMPRTAVGTVSTPAITTTNLANSIRRWRVTSAATASSPCDERSASSVCWRGNAAGLGGFTFVDRISMVTMVPTATGFFGLTNSAAAIAGTTVLSGFGACVGFGFDRATDANWQILRRDGTAALTKTDLGAAFPVDSTTNVYTLILYSAPNGASIWAEIVEEVSGTRSSLELTTNIPTSTQLLTPRHYLTNGTTATAVAYDCSGLYLETDF